MTADSIVTDLYEMFRDAHLGGLAISFHPRPARALAFPRGVLEHWNPTGRERGHETINLLCTRRQIG